MKLQLTIDHGKDFEVLRLVDTLANEVDIVEIGFPMLITFGLGIVKQIREKHPDLCIFVDAKIFHGGTGVTERCFEAGANIVSVLSAAPDPVITKMVEKAKGFGGQVACDLSCPPQHTGRRTAEVDELGVDYIIVPSGYLPSHDYDLESHRISWLPPAKVKPLDIAVMAKRNMRHAKLGIGTGINESNIRDVVALGPELVLVGRGILDAKDRALAAARLKRYMPFEG